MKIKHKLLLHTTILLTFLSTALILATLYLARQGRDTVLREMQERFDVLQSLTISQFEKARAIADAGISEASSLEAIDKIIQTTHNSQNQFLDLVTSEVGKANTTVEQTLIDQADMAVGSLDALQNSSIAFISKIIEDDSKTSQLLFNVSIANIEALENASLESLKRFDQERGYFDSEITAKQNQINDRIDRILADLLLASFDPAMSQKTYQNLLVERLETFKQEMQVEQQKIFGNLFDQLELQQLVLVEEIRLTVKKIEWAIERERQFSIRVNDMQSAGILRQLNSAHAQINKGVTDSSMMVGETLISLGKTLEEQLNDRSGQTNRVLAAKFAETRSGAEDAKSFVGQRIADNTRAAQDLFSTAIVEARQVIEASLQASQRKTVTTAIVITAGCAVLGLLLSVLLTRNLMDPVARVVHFAQKLALGDRSERLPEGSDEMGIMSKTLNTMSDELQRLEQATINSFVETLDQVLDCVFMLDPDSFRFIYVNQGAVEHLGYEREQLLNMSPMDIATEISTEDMRNLLLQLKKNPAGSQSFTTTHRTSSGENVPVDVLLRYVVPPGSTPRYIAIVRDISDRIRERREKEEMQSELMHKQKLESVGQLASGIAHEINTPVQYIGTNMDFLAESYTAIQECIRGLRDGAADWPEESRQQFESALERLDWDYLEQEIPLAVEQSLDGVRRVSSLVLAMKQFSHPSGKELVPANVHDVITTALTVTRNEWKYVAEVETDFVENLPQVPLLVDEFGQVLLNLIINAVHAITERQQISGEEVQGLITIRTACTETMVEIEFQDNGMGIPENVVAKVFDPFFTTKEVGKGTGQGLAISRDVIVKKHGGTISVRSEQGSGTIFTIRLPRNTSRREISENS